VVEKRGEVWLSPLIIVIPNGDGSTVDAIGGVMFGVILSINNKYFYMWGASFILMTFTPWLQAQNIYGSGNFSEESAVKHFPKQN